MGTVWETVRVYVRIRVTQVTVREGLRALNQQYNLRNHLRNALKREVNGTGEWAEW